MQSVLESRRKVSLRDPRMLADLAVVDPALTDGCPKPITLASGLDAITQVIEPYLSPQANPLTDALARDAIPKGLVALARLMEGEDAAARDDMAYASLCGGICIANAALGDVHALAGPIGGWTGAPHGAVCGALLPQVLAANRAAGAVPARFSEVERWIGTALGEDLARWSRGHGLPCLGDLDLDRCDLPAVAAAAVNSSSMRGNPVLLPPEALVEIMEAAF